MRLPLLALLALHACKPAPPPEPAATSAPTPVVAPPPAPVVTVAAPEPEPAEDSEQCKCPAPVDPTEPTSDAEDDADDDAFDDEDPDGKTRRTRARRKLPRALAARLRARLPDLRFACDVVLAGPCSIAGDLDGDGKADDAVLVRDAAGAGGIAILWGAGGTELLGAGTRGRCWLSTELENLDGSSVATPCAEPIDADLDWLAYWELRTRKVEAGGRVRIASSSAPGAMGDGLMLSGSDAAALLYRNADGWVLMHLGF